MKKIFISLLLFATVAVSAQEVPTSFPRKFLIEHFTGTWCQYCPYGMFVLDYYTQESTIPHIWLSHHISDSYATTESEAIFTMSKADGVPGMMLNRTPQSQGTVFHPGYLLEMDIVGETEAEASVVIDHTFNPETRQLDVTVSGQVANTTTSSYLLTVLIKENGIMSGQSDAYYAYGKSWKEFLHPRISRAFLTAATGDQVTVENQAYSKSFTYTVDKNYKPENCCVVAYITPLSKSPIINAEQTPIVEGTTGGEHYLPVGITSSGAPATPEKITFDSMIVSKPSEDKVEVMLFSKKTVEHDMYSAPLQPILILDFNTTENTLPVDTFDIAAGNTINTLEAGSFDKVNMTYSGSRYQYVDPYALAEGEIIPYFTWRLNKGKMLVKENGDILIIGYFYNGKHFTMNYTAPISSAVDNIWNIGNQVETFMRDGQVIIRKNGVEYNLMGAIIK